MALGPSSDGYLSLIGNEGSRSCGLGSAGKGVVVALSVIAALAVVLGALVMSGKLDLVASGTLLSQTSAPFYLILTGGLVVGLTFVTSTACVVRNKCRDN
ncbi:MAG: hypothetical protein JSS62_03995 [Verrucomicrobia bacterium]|nr:hypothetical protein [Verrucomicrobiota bacterium]MBS0647067.1 hypothetical protein [Verrucomicrobiota bacterium]